MQQSVRLPSREKLEVVDLTREVAAVVAEARVREAICTVFVRHATAAIVIDETAGLPDGCRRRASRPPINDRMSRGTRGRPAEPGRVR
jgi:hypothetical protein